MLPHKKIVATQATRLLLQGGSFRCPWLSGESRCAKGRDVVLVLRRVLTVHVDPGHNPGDFQGEGRKEDCVWCLS